MAERWLRRWLRQFTILATEEPQNDNRTRAIKLIAPPIRLRQNGTCQNGSAKMAVPKWHLPKWQCQNGTCQNGRHGVRMFTRRGRANPTPGGVQMFTPRGVRMFTPTCYARVRACARARARAQGGARRIFLGPPRHEYFWPFLEHNSSNDRSLGKMSDTF